MLRQQLEADLKQAVESLGFPSTDIVLSIPQNTSFGDYTSNIALQLAKLKEGEGKQSPQEIAKKIVARVKSPDKVEARRRRQESSKSYLEKVEVVDPGFLNFFIKPEFLTKDVEEILQQGDNFGQSDLGRGEKVLVEFISANPTGPLTLANGRGGAMGDTLANVLEKNGYAVTRQYYVNDTGNQVRMLGESVLAVLGKMPAKQEHYQGEYIKELAEKFKGEINSQDGSWQDKQVLELGHKLANFLLETEIKPAVLKLGIEFDEYFSEHSLYGQNLVEKTLGDLKEKGLVYEEEGAVLFKSSQFGDEKDRVLMTSEERRGRSESTYFLADVAHHRSDFSKSYSQRINFLGADHHGYAGRIKAAMEAFGLSDRVCMVFFQFVRLFKEGKEVRMSKRAGNFVTLDELLTAVGKDVTRFFFLMYDPNTHIDFNLDLAKEQSNKNPVFYVQYAYARMSNILANSNLKTLASSSTGRSGQILKLNYQTLSSKEELNLIRHLGEFPELVQEVGKTYQVQKLTTYSMMLADFFHKFYEKNRVLGAESKELEEARLGLVQASRLVLGKTLKLMGVSAPQKM
ncbi:MAG: arginine--tRNA ligase [Armatimonadetes bacterium]|nr:MAG: arginine--tRNA ligase [Armatimonadota bacterium]